VRERDLGVDQLLNLVLSVVAVVCVVVVFVVGIVPAPPVSVAFIRRERAVCRLDIGEREDGFAPCPLGRDPQQGHAAGVGALQPGPAQRTRGVLVVEEVDEPGRWVGRGPAVIACGLSQRSPGT